MIRAGSFGRQAQWTAAAAAAVVLSLVAGAAGAVPAVAAPQARPGPPRPSNGPAVSGVKPVPPHFVTPRDAAKRSFVADKTTWPAAATASISLPAPASTTPASLGTKTRGAGVPVWVQTVAGDKGGYPGPSKMDLRVFSRAAAKTAGINGVLLSVTPAGPGTGAVRVGLDYATFAQAYGGNYGSRLRLVSLPACVLTTPTVAACRQATPLTSQNDPAGQSVSAQLPLTATASGAASPMVLAAVAGAGEEGGAGGTYAATDLKPSGSWSGGGSTGSFTYSYPITAPPATSDLMPTVALSYDSGSVDGQTSSTQAQASWVGEGWSTPRSFIEQSFVSCADNPGGSPSPVSTFDSCYNGPILTLALNGSSTSLVWDAGKQVWKPEGDNGEVITHVTNSGNGTGTFNTDFWRVTTRDGTTYEFGRNHLPGWTAGKPVTNSVDSLPVYSAHAGDPCFDAAGFAASVCTMGYRWNLDYVKDVHGNAMAYYYKQDTNFYGRNKGSANVSYIRDSRLDRIDYGFSDGTAYGTPPNRVVFGTSDRCVSGTCQPLNDSTKANWPDVPFDLICASGTTCPSWSPSFFSTVRLTSITAQQYSTASSQYLPVDSYALQQTIPPTGDGTSPTLWLAGVTHTGHDTTAGGSAAPIALPSTSFTSIKLQNRVDSLTDGLPAFYRHRIETVTTETGSAVTASYDRPAPCTAPVTLNPATNTRSCYPVNWTPDGFSEPFRDWFNKYAVTKVTSTDPTSGAAATATSYAYPGGAAWHFDDNEVVKAKYRSYGQFRGYGRVQTRTGDGVNDPQTLAETSYYRGMSRNNSATVVNVTDSAGGVHEDVNELAGSELETTAYLGDGGPVDHSTITSYWVSPATATRNRTGLAALTGNWVAPVLTYTRQAITTGGTTTWRNTQTDNSYDAAITSPTFGLLRHTHSHTVPADPAFDQCTSNTYAPVNTAKNLVGLVSETETVSVACGGFTPGSPASVPGSVNTLTAPATVNRPAQVVANERTFYDDPSFATTFPQPNPPTAGDVTMTRNAADWTGGAYTYQTAGRAEFDSFGRTTAGYDGNGNKTTTAYTMNPVGLTTAMSVTNPLNQTASTTLDPQRGLTLTATDPNAVVTTRQYDALGRATSIWLHSRPTTAPANYKFTYQVSKAGITAVITQKMNDFTGYQTSTVIYDALLRPRQTQAMTPQSGRMITDTFYDTHGWVTATFNGWWDPATLPNTTLVSAADLRQSVPNQTFNTYDGLGRTVIAENAKNGVTVSKTTTVYNGDRTTVIPPTGGVTKTTVTDPLGRTAQLQEYTTAPTLTTPSNTFTGVFHLAGGTTTAASYGYDGHGTQATVTDAQSNTWTSSYNLLGQVTARTDPDAGTTSIVYDGNGNLTQSTDARSKTISFTYDSLNRKTGKYAAPLGSQSTANQLSEWVYDNSNNAVPGMTNPIGHLTTATAYTGGAAYTTQQKNFNVFGESTGETVTIPTVEGLLGGTYTFSHVYSTNTGLIAKDVYPVKGGLPSETVNYTYDSTPLMLPKALGGIGGYSDGVTYDAFGRVNQQTLGAVPNQAFVTNTWDEHTGRLTDQLVTRNTTTPATVDKQHYDYDLAGNITKKISTRLDAATPSETQCYTYDTLARLTTAWTATDNCATTPTSSDHAMVGNNIGAGSAYWTSWDIDLLGNRTGQNQHNLAGGADATTTYTLDGNSANQPHTLTSTATTGGATAYGYDPAGNMTTRNAGQGNQTLTWNDANQLTTITGSTGGDSSFIYDADGNLLLQKDPGSTTLYLPGQQHMLNTATQTVTGTRYYALLGGGTCIRTGSGTNYTFALTDPQGTPTLYLDSTAQTPTWRQYTPYGQPRGAMISLVDNRGFLNKPEDAATGLTHLGAREYDSTTGRFISIDPIMDLANPQQWNGYSYANNTPITASDPAGLSPEDAQWDGPQPDQQSQLNTELKYGGAGCGAKCQKAQEDDRNKRKKPLTAMDKLGLFALGAKAGWDNWAKDTANGLLAFVAHPMDSAEKMYAEVLRWQWEYGLNEQQAWACVLTGVCDIYVNWKAGNYYESGYGAGALAYDIVFNVALEGAGLAGAAETRPFRAAARAGEFCSFSGDTDVLMADGTKKPIDEIKVGDEVRATDPETGEQGPRTVTHLWIHQDTLVGLSVNGKVLTTTEDHPYWNATDQQWERADALDAGDLLLTPDGDGVPVNGLVKGSTRTAAAYNLTVDDIHTYYVLAGNTLVLVHNGGPLCGVHGGASGSPAGAGIVEGSAPAKAFDMLDKVKNRTGGIGKVPGYEGNGSWGNKAGQLPGGAYREWDVNPTGDLPTCSVCGRPIRGGERLLTPKSGSGPAYYTPDHYSTFYYVGEYP